MSVLKVAGGTLVQEMAQFEKTMLEKAKSWAGLTDADQDYVNFLEFEKTLDQNFAGQAKALLKADKKKVKDLAGKFKQTAEKYRLSFTKFKESSGGSKALRESDKTSIEFLTKLRDDADAAATSGELSKEFKLRLKEVSEKWDKGMAKIKTGIVTRATDARSEVGERIIGVKAALAEIKKADIAGTVQMAAQWEALGQSQRVELARSLRDRMKKFENALRKGIDDTGVSQLDTQTYQSAELSVKNYVDAFESVYAQVLITTASGPVEKAGKSGGLATKQEGENAKEEKSIELDSKKLDAEIKNGATRLNNDAIELLKNVKNAKESVEELVNEVQGRRGLQQLDKNGISKKLETAMSDLNNFKSESEKLMTQYTNFLRKHKTTPDLLKKYVAELSSAKTKITGCDGLISNAKQQEQLIKNHLN